MLAESINLALMDREESNLQAYVDKNKSIKSPVLKGRIDKCPDDAKKHHSEITKSY